MQHTDKRPVSKNGFKFFTLGLLFAFLVGHFFKFYFNSNRLTQFFENKLIEQNLDYEFNISGINYVLSDGFWPAFGLVIDDLIITSKNLCERPLQVVLKDSFVKIKTIKSILNKKIQLSSVRVGSARVLQSKALCESRRENQTTSELEALLYESNQKFSRELSRDAEVLKPKSNSKAQLVNLSNKLKEQLAIFFQRNELYLKDWPKIGVEEIFYIKDGQNFVLQNFLIEPGDESLNINGDINFSFSKIELQGLPIVQFKMQLSKPELQAKVSTRYKEGRIRSELNLDWLTLNYNIATKLSDLPVHSLLKWLQQQSLYEESWQPELLWLSCELTSDGNLNKPSAIVMQLEPCTADAEKGQFEIKNLKVDPFSPLEFQPFMINVSSIPIKSFLKSLNKTGPYRIFSEFGSLSGQVVVNSLNSYEANWSLQDLEALFSKNGVNAFQKINKLDLKMSYEKQRFSGLIENVVLKDGEFEGTFSYNFDQSLKNGMIQFGVKNLILNPSVQTLLVGKNFTGVSLYGQAKVVDTEILNWRGNLGVAKIQSHNASYENLKAEFKFDSPALHSTLKVKKITATSSDLYNDLLNSMSLNFESGNGVYIESLSTQVISQKGKGQWEGLSARLKRDDKNFWLKSNGSWENKSFSGSIDVFDSAKQSWKWLILGSFQELFLAPSTSLIEQVQTERLKGYNIPKEKFKKGMSSSDFKDIDFKNKSPLEVLKSLGVNFIESAKSIIPNK